MGTQTGNADGGDGGDGGFYGVDGSPGTSPTGFNFDFAGALGGTAGKAIELNGGTVNFLSGGGSPNIRGAVS